MKNLMVLMLLLLSLAAGLSAQEIENDQVTTSRRIGFGLSAGPSFLRFKPEAFNASLRYHWAVFAEKQFRKSSLQISAEYLPLSATFGGYPDHVKFSNHLVNLSTVSKLTLGRARRLSIDLGASFAISAFQTDDFVEPGPLVCLEGGGWPITVNWQMFLIGGSTWRLSDRYSIGIRTLIATDVVPEGDYGSAYYTFLQGSVNYIFLRR